MESRWSQIYAVCYDAVCCCVRSRVSAWRRREKNCLFFRLIFSTLPLLSATLNCLNNSGIQPAHTHGSARQSTCAHVCGKQTVLFAPRQSQKLSIKLYFVIPYWFICRVYKPHFLLPTEHVEKNRCPRLKTSRDVASYSCGGGGKGE